MGHEQAQHHIKEGNVIKGLTIWAVDYKLLHFSLFLSFY